MKRGTKSDGRTMRRESKFLARFLLVLFTVIILSAIAVLSYFFIDRHIHNSNSVVTLYDSWEKYDYKAVYDISNNIIDRSFLHNTARTLHGYSAFYLAVSEVDNAVAQNYLDEALNNLRIAMQNATDETLPQIYYMLGKTYFFKYRISDSHYYADLAVEYLLKAQSLGYQSNDTAEYLGLSYAELGETQKSIEAFTEALLEREADDTLLLAIAKQYYKSGQGAAAKQYLQRVTELTKNEDLLLQSHILLGQILTDEEKYSEAQKEFEAILEKNENSADAHYALGVLYEKQGDLAKARAEWRTCLRIQVNHPEASIKMSDSR